MDAPLAGDWVALLPTALPCAEATTWAITASCGAVVSFLGTVRDHAEGRRGVTGLTYESYDGPAQSRMLDVVAELRLRWPDTGRVAVLHRVGQLALSDVAVVVVVSAPHRPEAFDAARFAIDAVKATVPIWKREHWPEGEAWGTNAAPLVSPHDVAVAP